MRLLHHRALPWAFVLVSCLLVLAVKLHREDPAMPAVTVATTDRANSPPPTGDPSGTGVTAPSSALRLSGIVGLWVWIGAALAWIWRGHDRDGKRRRPSVTFGILALVGWLLWAGSTALM